MGTTTLASTDLDPVNGARTFPFVGDENGSTYYGYGHQDKAAFAAALDDFFRLTDAQCPPVDLDEVHHFYAVVPDDQNKRFKWVDESGEVGAQTPGSFPITLADF